MRRNAVTLVELLVTITIITMLAGVGFKAYSSAKESARTARTRSLIMRLNRVIADEFEAAYAARLPVITRNMDPIQRSLAIRNAKYDYLRMTCPDRWSDVLGPPLYLVPPITGAPHVPHRTLAMRNMHANAVNRLVAGGMSNTDAVNLVEKHGASELLYIIIRMTVPDQFSEINFADTDGDGLSEIVDAWGTPIRWIRWPSGFRQDPPPPNPLPVGYVTPPPRYRADVTLVNEKQRDGVDRAALIPDDFALVPLIYSAGPDKQYDISIGHAANGQTYAYKIVRYVLPSHRELNPGSPRAEWVIRTCTLDDNPYTDSDPNTADWPDGKPIGLPWDGDDGQGGGPDGKEGWWDNIHNQQQNRKVF